MGRLIQLLIMFGPMIMRAYSQYQRQQSRNQKRGGYQQTKRKNYEQTGRGSRYEEVMRRRATPDNSKFKKSGVAKYKEYDYKGAIEDFNKALEINPYDANAHFNIACAYSLTEKASKAFVHLDQAVGNGYKDLQSIEDHDGLAYLRVQKNFEKFRNNGYRLLKTK